MLLSGIGKPYDPVSGTGTVGRNYSYQNLNRVTLFFDESVQANGFIGIGGGGATFDDLNGNQLDNAKAGFIGGGVIWARQPGAGPVRGISTAPGVPNWGSAWKQGVKDAFRHSFYYEVQGACMSYRANYLDLDPTYRDAFGRPLLRMTFDWNDNEIRASQFLVGKALDMCKVLNPKALSGDAKKDRRALQHHALSEHPYLRRRHHGREPEHLGAESLSAILGCAQCVRAGRQRLSAEQWLQPDGHGRRADLLGSEGHSRAVPEEPGRVGTHMRGR